MSRVKKVARRSRITKPPPIPTLLLFDEGVLVRRMKGNTSKSDLLAELKDLKEGLDVSKVQLKPVVSASASAFTESSHSRLLIRAY